MIWVLVAHWKCGPLNVPISVKAVLCLPPMFITLKIEVIMLKKKPPSQLECWAEWSVFCSGGISGMWVRRSAVVLQQARLPSGGLYWHKVVCYWGNQHIWLASAPVLIPSVGHQRGVSVCVWGGGLSCGTEMPYSSYSMGKKGFWWGNGWAKRHCSSWKKIGEVNKTSGNYMFVEF